MSIKHRFASAIYHARTEKALTQAKVAEAVGVSTRWYQRIEKGERLPATVLALKIIAFLEIDGKMLKEADTYVSVYSS